MQSGGNKKGVQWKLLNQFFRIWTNYIYIKQPNWCKIMKMIFFPRFIQTYTETFRCEKCAWNTIISGTREFWDLRLKTKSWNFFEVRWRPYSPKKSFWDDFVINLKEAGTKVLASQLFLDCRARRSGWVGSTTLISSAFTALLNCAEVWRRNRILTNDRFLSHSLLFYPNTNSSLTRVSPLFCWKRRIKSSTVRFFFSSPLTSTTTLPW